jgi:4-amino-4-deoxy-L-arabinose transferase-like glycosyltransferase
MDIKLLFGIVFSLELLVLPFLAVFCLKTDKPLLALMLILAVGLQLRLFAASDPYLHDWDEKYHALVAKHLAKDPLRPLLYEDPIEDYDYRQWTNNHVWLHKPPMVLWVMAGFVKVFGANEFAIRLPSLLLSLLSVFLTFLIGSELFSKRTGVLAAFFLAINGFYLDITAGRTTTDHVDCAFLFFVLLGIFLSIKYYSSKQKWMFAVAAVACGLGLLTKWLPAMLVVGLFGLMGLTNKVGLLKNAVSVGIFTVIAFLVYLPWRLHVQQQFPLDFTWEQAYNLRHLTEALEGHRRPWWYFLDRIRIIWNEAIYLALAFVGWRVVKFKRNNELLLLAWLVAPLVVFSFSATKMPGYVLIAAPAAFISLALFCEFLLKEFKHKKLGIAAVVVIVLLAQRYCLERVKLFHEDHKKAIVTLEIKRLKGVIGSAPTVLYGNPFSIETMFYTDCISYPGLPTEKGLENAFRKGYQVMLLENGGVPQGVFQDGWVLKIKSSLATKNPN